MRATFILNEGFFQAGKEILECMHRCVNLDLNRLDESALDALSGDKIPADPYDENVQTLKDTHDFNHWGCRFHRQRDR